MSTSLEFRPLTDPNEEERLRNILTPAELQVAGQISANERALAAATAIFTGPQPWMQEMF